MTVSASKETFEETDTLAQAGIVRGIVKDWGAITDDHAFRIVNYVLRYGAESISEPAPPQVGVKFDGKDWTDPRQLKQREPDPPESGEHWWAWRWAYTTLCRQHSEIEQWKFEKNDYQESRSRGHLRGNINRFVVAVDRLIDATNRLGRPARGFIATAQTDHPTVGEASREFEEAVEKVSQYRTVAGFWLDELAGPKSASDSPAYEFVLVLALLYQEITGKKPTRVTGQARASQPGYRKGDAEAGPFGRALINLGRLVHPESGGMISSAFKSYDERGGVEYYDPNDHG